ncbi:mannose-6-phosphate isomerase, type 1 [Singulisphaera sp. GP187]|nr:mannose-6-phosphate isomerase, type 1 [Singulisphaera sp. GP187]
MRDVPLYPLRFDPILKQLIWGGRRLETILRKPLGAGTRYAESWEIADHRDDVSQVAEGPLKGVSLRDLIQTRGNELLGQHLGPASQFPLLVKYIDAHQVLSVQVHPDDAKGKLLANDNGKTEAWVIIHAEPGSLIYAGLNPGVTRPEFAEALKTGQVEPLLHRFEAKPGDCIMIPAGTVHAIGAGVVLAEIQQMSDATFRVYDWGRVGTDGRPRPLHLAEALESTNYAAGPVDPLNPTAIPIAGGTREPLARCPYFALERLRLNGPTTVGSHDRFTILLGLAGDTEIRTGETADLLGFGQTRLLPSSLGECQLVPRGESVVLTCVVP